MVVRYPTEAAVVTHLDLPETDGLPVDNFFQDTQADLLTSAVWPLLEAIHPGGDFAVGVDSGIYWDLREPRLSGCKVPDWFYVPCCRPTPEGTYRRSYVMWDEIAPPRIIIEFISNDRDDEHDDTPETGKFWIYRHRIQPTYYVIHDPLEKTLEVYERDDTEFLRRSPDADGLYRLPEFPFALGHWEGEARGLTLTWLRFFDQAGRMLPTAPERTALVLAQAQAFHREADAAKAQADAAKAQADAAKAQADVAKAQADAIESELAALRAKLLAKGIDPDAP